MQVRYSVGICRTVFLSIDVVPLHGVSIFLDFLPYGRRLWLKKESLDRICQTLFVALAFTIACQDVEDETVFIHAWCTFRWNARKPQLGKYRLWQK